MKTATKAIIAVCLVVVLVASAFLFLGMGDDKDVNEAKRLSLTEDDMVGSAFNFTSAEEVDDLENETMESCYEVSYVSGEMTGAVRVTSFESKEDCMGFYKLISAAIKSGDNWTTYNDVPGTIIVMDDEDTAVGVFVFNEVYVVVELNSQEDSEVSEDDMFELVHDMIVLQNDKIKSVIYE